MEQFQRWRGGWGSRTPRRGTKLRGEKLRRPDLEGLEPRALLSIIEYPLGTSSVPEGITTGPDGRGGQEIWFAQTMTHGVVTSMTAGGQIDKQINVGPDPMAMTSVPNGGIWFTQFDPTALVGSIGMIDPSTGAYHSVALAAGTEATALTYDPADGYIWFVQFNPNVASQNAIGYINPASFSSASDLHTTLLPASEGANPRSIAITYDAADQSLWFSNAGSNTIGMYNPAAGTFNSAALTLPGGSTTPGSITADSGGNLWFVESGQAIGSYNLNTGFGPRYQVPGVAGNFAIYNITSGRDGQIYFTVGGSGYSQIETFNPATITSSSEIGTTTTPSQGANPYAIAAGPDGNIWFTETNGLASGQDAGNGAIAVLPITQLSVAAPVGVTSGSPFTLTVKDVYQGAPGVTDSQFNGPVTIQLGSGPGSLSGTLTVNAVNGVATFSGLTVSQAGSYVIQAGGNDASGQTPTFGVTTPTPTTPTPTPTTPTPTPTTPTPTPTTPTPTSTTPSPTPPAIVTAQINSVFLKHNKRGKGIGKPVEQIVFTFSTAMNPGTIDNSGDYQVTWTSIKRVKRQLQTIPHPVSVMSATPNASDTSVTLVTNATVQRFAKGGQVIIAAPAIQSAAGVSLGGKTTFQISPRAGGIG